MKSLIIANKAYTELTSTQVNVHVGSKKPFLAQERYTGLLNVTLTYMYQYGNIVKILPNYSPPLRSYTM